MKIFLDTNVFYNDWFATSANFKYLFHFINNEAHELVVSNLVIQEVENLRLREITSAFLAMQKDRERLKKANGAPVFAIPDNFGPSEYNLRAILQKRVEAAVFLEYGFISQHTVVERALKRKRPFQKAGTVIEIP